MIKVVTFDLDGVYFLNGKANFITNLGKLGVSEEEVKRVFLKSDEMNQKYKRGLINGQEFWSWAISEWGIQKSVQEIVDLLILGYEVNSQAQELVKKLRRKGIKTAICSNNFPERIKGLNKKFDFLKDFEVVVLSYEVGVIKPEKEIFEALIAKSGARPEEIFYSDDYPPAVEAASRVGIKAIFYENFDQFERSLKKFGIDF